MNILADESVDQPIVNRLREDGHTVLYVAEMDPGISDEVVLQEANNREFLLLTADIDFGELVSSTPFGTGCYTYTACRFINKKKSPNSFRLYQKTFKRNIPGLLSHDS